MDGVAKTSPEERLPVASGTQNGQVERKRGSVSSDKHPENGTWSHRMTDEERRQAIEEALQRRKPLFRLTEGQVVHIGRVEREIREAHVKARQR